MNKTRPTATYWIVAFCIVVAFVAFGTITAQMQPHLAKPDIPPVQGPERIAKRKPGAPHATANTVTVNTLDDQDNGACSLAHCSLREAVKYAPAGSDVVFSVTGTIVTGSEIPFNQNINIDGPGVSVINVSGNNDHRVFQIATGNTVSINSLTVANGHAPSAFSVGGGIYNNGGTLTVTECVVRNNFADSGGGGFVTTGGTTTFNRCTFNDNNGGTDGGAPGGAVYANGGSVIVNINNCTFNNNHARSGGALALLSGAMNVSSATIAGNSAGFCDGFGCSAAAGGFLIGGGTATISNTILAGNTIAGNPNPTSQDVLGTVASGDYNLIQNGGGWSFTSGGTHNLTGLDPLLGSLQDNGGPTPTMALASNSPALDQGKSFGLITDQRGFFRPADDPSIANAAGGDGSDIGAYERAVPCAVFATVYVDDNWVGTTPGADPDGPGPATVFGCDSFATIQGGVNGVAPGGTVNVAAGTYSVTQIIINTKLTLQGAGAAVTTIDGGNFEIVPASGSEPGTIFIHDTDASSPVKIDGFKFINPSIWDDGGGEIVSVAASAPLAPVTISHNHFIGVATVSSNLFDNAIWMYWPQGGGVTNITDNEFEHEWQPILLELPIPGAVVTGNSFHDLFASVDGGTFPPQAMSLWAYGGLNVTAAVTINTNTFSNFDGWSIVLRGGGAPVTSGGTENAQFLNDVTIHGNQINADGAGIVLRNPATNLDNPISGAAQDGIVGAMISGNTIASITPGSGTGIWLRGPNNNTTILSNSITGHANGILSEQYNVVATSSGVAVHLNSITGNTTGISNQGPSIIDAQNNWWGCNYGPGATGAGCSAATNSSVGPVTTNPWIVLGVSASPNPIAPGGTSTVTADMTHNSDALVPVGGTVPLMPVAFTATQGTMAPPTGTITAGQATSLFTSTGFLSGTGCATVDNQLTCTAITVNTPTFTIDDVTHNEGDVGTTAYTFTITKTGATTFNSSVDYATVNGTATAPSDFTAILTTNVVFLSADTTKQVTVLVNGDTTFEPTEAFTVHLSNPMGATIADADGTGTITNDDPSCIPPAIVYVDDNWVGTTPGTDPDGAGPATNFGCDSFATIQDGVNGVASGGTVNVRAGTYAESVLINKPLTLRGAKVGQNAATRFAIFGVGANGPKANPALESIITAAATIPNSNTNNTVHVDADNVTIDGFVVDGNNPALNQTGAVVVGGINTDARRGIETENATGTFFAANSVTVRNNIIQNFAQRGIELINGLDSGTAPATTGSVITGNVIRNFSTTGIELAFNAYADVTSNTITGVDFADAGVMVQDYTNNSATPRAMNISNNIVTVGQDSIGIWANLMHAPGPAVTTVNINNNTVNASDAVTGTDDFTYGIYLTSLQDGTTPHVTGNVVGASGGVFARGIALWNLPTTTATTVTGGTVGNSLKCVSLHDNDPNFGLAGANSAVNMSGVAIFGMDIGVLVDASGSTGDTVAMQISGNTSVSFCTTGISVVGTNASANIHDNPASIHDNTVGIEVNGGSATITGNNLYANATGLRFKNGASGTAHFNRIISTTTAIDNPNNLTPNLENNWWGCNAGPGNAGCGAVTGTGADFNPWIVLGVSASPNPIAPGGTSTVTADMTHNSDALVPLGGTVPLMPVAFSATQGTMAPPTGTITAGQATSLFTSTGTLSGTGCATVDNQLTCTAITVTVPSFTIDDVTHNEGDVGTTSYVFTITKTGATAFNSSVDYATVNGTATAPSDFTAIPTTNFVFLPADTTKQVTVTVNGDTMVEPTEAFTVHLSNASGATIADADGLGTITNDDSCAVFTTVYVDDNWVGTTPGTDPDGPGPATNFGCDSFATIQDGVNGVAPGGTVNVAVGVYVEIGQIVISKNLSIVGANNVTTIVRPAQDTGTSGDTKGWFLVQSGKTFHLSNVRLDGSGRKTYQAIRYNGSGTVNNVKFTNIQYEVSGPTYNGGGVRIGAGNVDVTNCTFDNMGRYGVLVDGVGSGTLSGNTYTGKGAGDWLDYGFDIEFGGNVTISNNQILHNRGVASSDGSDSAGISVWDDPGTQATITGNTITDSSTGVALAIASGSSDPVVTIQAGNIISGGGVGIGIQNAGATGAPTLTVTGSTITGNTTTGLLVPAGMSNVNVNVHFNRISGNTSGVNNAGANSVNAENNWWGCNAGPGNAGCDGVSGTVDFNPWIVLLGSATPSTIAPGGTSTVAADMTHNSDNAVPVGTLPNIPDSYSATNGTMNPTTGTIIAGAASSLFTSTNTSNAVATITVDNQQVNVPITVTVPSFTIDDVTHNEGDVGTTAFTFTITKTGATALNSSVDYATVNGTATAPSDFTAIPTTNFVFLPADTTKQVTVLVNGDTMIEPTETFTVHLSNASGASIADADGLGTITNDDSCAAFATVYVDDNWAGTTPGTDPDGPGPATNFGCDSFATIQDGVNGVASGGQVIVRAGTYAEAVLINKPLMLLGAQVGQNANTRFAAFTPGANGPKANPAIESVITAAATAPSSGANDTLHVMAANVTIDGFVVDGNNPSLIQTGATVIGGINTDSRRAIQTEDAAGNPFAANNVTVKNNVVQNFAQRGVELINGAASNTAPATTGSLITLNRIRNFGLDGIVLAFNPHADITFNTVDTNDYPTEAGIWVQDFLNTGTPHTINITNNNVTVGQDNFGGIWINLAYLPTININNNTINAAASVASGSDFTYGIYITSLRPGSNASLNGNIVGSTGGTFDRGIALWNLGTGQTTTLTGGTVGHSTKGVSLHDNDPNFGLAGSNSAVDLSGVAVSGTSVGILVDAAGSTGDTVAMQISGNTSISGCTTGISVVGTNASANIHDNAASIHDNTTGIDVSGGFTITSNNLFANATGLRFSTGASGTAHFNRIVSTTTAIDNPNNLTPNLENNWWGCNAGPGNAGCGAVTGTGADFNPWIVLLGSATPSTIAPGGTSTVAADMTHNSDNAVPVGTLPNIPDSYSATNGTMNPTTGTIIAGAASSLFTSTNTSNAVATITVDNQQVNVPITVTVPSFTIDDVTHNEGDVGTTAFTFTITKTGATALNSSVDYATVSGTATAPSDFTAIPTTNVVFLPADTTKQVTVLVNGDTTEEPNETFTVHLSNPVGATISDADGLGMITNDDACNFSLSSNAENFSAAGGTSSVNVITGKGCAWTAVSNDAFITVNSGTPGSGNGTVGYTVAANIGPGRMGTMTIAGKTFTVTQDAGCTFTLNRDHESFAGNGGTGTVNVAASDAGCAWTASTTSLFITITSGGSGTGNGAVQYTVAINPGPGIRSDTITIAGHIYTVYQGINFLDVPSNDPFYDDIGKLAARGVTVGCGNGNYCPNATVLREQMAAFILRAKGEFDPPMPGSQRFTDVPATNLFYNFIDRLAELQITLGCTPDHSQYCPGDPVPREQMAVFILRGLGEFDPPTPGSQRFTDVPPTNLFYNFIDRLAVLEITLGCTPDHLMYCPNAPVTRKEMAAFLVRAFDL